MMAATRRSSPVAIEGALFQIPLRSGGYGIGLVARTSRIGLMLSYGFDRIYDVTPSIDQLQDLQPTDACNTQVLSDAAVTKKRWNVIGPLRCFQRAAWPNPPFRWIDRLIVYVGPRFRLVELRDVVPQAELPAFPPDLGWGTATLLEVSLDMAIRERSPLHYFHVQETSVQRWTAVLARAGVQVD